MKITMIGSGYVGLVSGACFSEFGAIVTCYDVDKNKIEDLGGGNVSIYEPGLDTLIQTNLAENKLKFVSDLKTAVQDADLIFIAVGTPSRRGDGYADLTYVFDAVTELAKYLSGYSVIVNKSTVPVGTARKVSKLIQTTNPAADFDVVSNPEFLREGAAISDFMRPDRIVIGVESERAKSLIGELYRPLNLRETPILFTDLESAELIKYASNAFLATKISFINELSELCESVGADVHAIAKGMGMDKRIGDKFLHPGPGYGGSCFPKDAAALLHMANLSEKRLRIVEAAVEANTHQQKRMVTKILTALKGKVEGKEIGCLGLTFKPETDDIRESPAITIIKELVESGIKIKVFDPKGMAAARKILPPGVSFCERVDGTFQGADALVILTEWNAFRGLDLNKVREQMRGNILFDLRNIYERDVVESIGLRYFCVGRAAKKLNQ